MTNRQQAERLAKQLDDECVYRDGCDDPFLDLDESIPIIQSALDKAAQDGWNEAIEKAAIIGEQFEIQNEVSSRIRALKKGAEG